MATVGSTLLRAIKVVHKTSKILIVIVIDFNNPISFNSERYRPTTEQVRPCIQATVEICERVRTGFIPFSIKI